MRQKPEFQLARRMRPGVSQIERVYAARAILNGARGSEALALHAFMAIFHPNYPAEKLRKLLKPN